MSTERAARAAVDETLREAQDGLEREVAFYRVFLYAVAACATVLVRLAQPGGELANYYFTAVLIASVGLWALVRRFGARPWIVYGSLLFDLLASTQVTTLTAILEPGRGAETIQWAMALNAVSVLLVLIVNMLRNNARAALVGAIAAPCVYLPTMAAVAPIAPPVAVSAGMTAAGGLVGWFAARQARRLLESYARHRMLKRFLPGEAFDRIVSQDRDTSEEALTLGGRRVVRTVLATDLRGFTAMSERLDPERTIEQLNAYHGAMHEVLEAHGGVLDKFMGDGALVLFGRGEEDAGASAAVACGRAMLERLETLNLARAKDGLPPLAMGIGIHTGEVIAGNIGSERRLEATVIGDPVNTAARLESMTKEAGVPMLVSGVTVSRLAPGHGLEDLGPMEIRGKSEPLPVYALRPAVRARA